MTNSKTTSRLRALAGSIIELIVTLVIAALVLGIAISFEYLLEFISVNSDIQWLSSIGFIAKNGIFALDVLLLFLLVIRNLSKTGRTILHPRRVKDEADV